MEYFIMSAEIEAWFEIEKEIQRARRQKENAEMILEYYGVR